MLQLSAWLHSGFGQTVPAGVPQKPVEGKKPAYIRFWNMLPPTDENDLQLLASDRDSLMGATPGDVYADYIAVPSGNCTLIVRRLAAGSTPFMRTPTVLPEGTFLTLLASEKNGRVAVEAFNDTPDPKASEPTGKITMRQFFPGAQVTASIGNAAASQPLSYGETAVLEGVPETTQVNIKLTANLPTKPPTTRVINLTGDFSVLHRATLLLVADSYGRFRPQLAMDARAPKATSN